MCNATEIVLAKNVNLKKADGGFYEYFLEVIFLKARATDVATLPKNRTNFERKLDYIQIDKPEK